MSDTPITLLADEAGRAFRERDQFSSIVAASDKWVKQQDITNPMLRAACRQSFESAARLHVPLKGPERVAYVGRIKQAYEAGRAFRDAGHPADKAPRAAIDWVREQAFPNPTLRYECLAQFTKGALSGDAPPVATKVWAAASERLILGAGTDEPTNPQSYQCAGCDTMVDGRSNLCLPCTNQAVQDQPDHSGLFLLGLREPGEMGRGEFSDEMYRQGDLIAEGLERSLERWKPGDRCLFYAYMVGRLKGAEIHAAHEQASADKRRLPTTSQEESDHLGTSNAADPETGATDESL